MECGEKRNWALCLTLPRLWMVLLKIRAFQRFQRVPDSVLHAFYPGRRVAILAWTMTKTHLTLIKPFYLNSRRNAVLASCAEKYMRTNRERNGFKCGNVELHTSYRLCRSSSNLSYSSINAGLRRLVSKLAGIPDHSLDREICEQISISMQI